MLDHIKSMIWKFDDTAYLGELLAAISDKLQAEREDCSDPAKQAKQDHIIELLNGAIDNLCVFGEDEDWPSWESVLDAVYGANLQDQISVITIAKDAVSASEWRASLSPLNSPGVDFDRIAADLATILAEINSAFD